MFLGVVQDPLLRTWGKNIRAHRHAAKLTQEELANRLTPPVKQATIARWEAGVREPRRPYRSQLAGVLGSHVGILFPHPQPDEAA